MTIRLEQLRDGSLSDSNFQALMNLVPDTGGRSVGIRFGTGTFTFPGASAVTSTTVVTHGLGTTPIAAFVTPTQGAGYILVCETFTYTSTTFSTNAITSDNSLPAGATTKTFVWLVIG